MKEYIGLKCPRCGGHLDLLIEPRQITMGDDRSRAALKRTPAVYVEWARSIIPHDCDNPNDNGQSYVDRD
jgi:hypothetical protein